MPPANAISGLAEMPIAHLPASFCASSARRPRRGDTRARTSGNGKWYSAAREWRKIACGDSINELEAMKAISVAHKCGEHESSAGGEHQCEAQGAAPNAIGDCQRPVASCAHRLIENSA